jgi:hypothetical protein
MVCTVGGICPACTTRYNALIAAHRVDHVFPLVPVRPSVLSLPALMRYLLEDAIRLSFSEKSSF